MLRKCLTVLAAVAGLGLAACSGSPNDPMPGDDGMGMARVAAADSVSR